MYIVLAQVFKIISAFFGIAADKSSNRKKIYLYNAISNFFSGVQYYFLNAIAGAISSFVAIFRNVIFYKYQKKVPLYVLILFLIGLILINCGSYVNYLSIIPVSLVVLYTVALYINKVRIIKYVVIITCLLEIVYDVYYLAYAGIVVCVIDTILVIRSLIVDKKLINKEDKKIK